MFRQQALQDDGIAGIDGGHRLPEEAIQEFRVVHRHSLPPGRKEHPQCIGSSVTFTHQSSTPSAEGSARRAAVSVSWLDSSSFLNKFVNERRSSGASPAIGTCGELDSHFISVRSIDVETTEPGPVGAGPDGTGLLTAQWVGGKPAKA